jgi:hypothetical protein
MSLNHLTIDARSDDQVHIAGKSITTDTYRTETLYTGGLVLTTANGGLGETTWAAPPGGGATSYRNLFDLGNTGTIINSGVELPLSITGPGTPDMFQVGNRVRCTTSGNYRIEFTVAFSAVSTTTNIQLSLGLNAAGATNFRNYISYSPAESGIANTYKTASLSCTIPLAANDEVYIHCDSIAGSSTPCSLDTRQLFVTKLD